MNNAKIKEIVKFSFTKYFQNKWFVIFNILSLLAIVISLNWGNVSSLINFDGNKDEFEIEVLDQQNIIFDSFFEGLSGDKKLSVKKVTENNYTANDIPDNIIVLEVNEDANSYFKVKFITKEGIKYVVYEQIDNLLNKIKDDRLMKEYNYDTAFLSKIKSPVSVERVMLSVDSENSDFKEIIKALSACLTYMIAVLIFTRIANEISQEKASKSSEYVLTAVSGKEYLFAKVFSNIAILLIQFLLLLSYYLIAAGILSISKIASTDISLAESMNISGLSIDIIVYILTLFILNILSFILLSIVQGTIAAKTSSSSEAGNTVSILIFVMMTLYILTLALIDPYSKVSLFLYVISVLPVLSSYFVPAMMIIGQATTLQVVISIILLIISIPIVFNICGNLFKNGILDYTKVKKKTKKLLSLEEQQQKYLNKREYSKLGMVIGIGILILICSQMIITLLFTLLVSPFLNKFLEEGSISLILQIVTQILSIGLTFLFIRSYTSKNNNVPLINKLNNFKFVPNKFQIILMAFSLVYLFNIFLSLVIYPKVGLDYDMTSILNIDSSGSLISKILLVFALSIIPGIFEELIFRKGLIDLLIPYGKKLAIFISALLFALIHLNISQGIFAFVIGLIFGLIYVLTNDIKLSILIHIINNGIAVLAILLPEKGLEIFSLLVLLICIIGLYYVFRLIFSNKLYKNINFNFNSLKTNIKTKYVYLFYSFIFDVALIMTFILGFMTENTLKSLIK